MNNRIELGLNAHTQTVLVQMRDTGAVSIFISLPQVSVMLECTPMQAMQLADVLLKIGGSYDAA
jgi:hypothetical protein